MSMRAIAMWLLFVAVAAAQLAVPRLGCIVDEEQRLRPVLGVAGNFLMGKAEAEGVIAAACSGDMSLLKREDSLEVRTRGGVASWPAPPGPALFGLSRDGAAALVYFPESKEWFRVRASSLVRLPPLEGDVVAIGNPQRPAAVVRRADGLWFAGADERPVPEGVSEPLLLLPDGNILFSRGKELVLAGRDETERCFPLPAPAAALEWMGRGWVRVKLTPGDGHLAFALDDRNDLFRLPEVAP